ncbi:hypothetical protein [Sporanaerobacter acetigenes]|uniref:Uncharacterized protein n=1 Tax=Sporanaerobacter acetigenes DSM 13106 TaxID=1123281 RepID=A0A1M5U907_9FIRM|nr:hypothetical protein [Sporanaerobacter acetigenes]SHH59464.1 hypothetical protein SAMN02745180_00564 [Sporanaerobacter acetigenes DSM 13106]
MIFLMTIVLIIFSLLFTSITIELMKKYNNDYKTLNIDEWKKLKVINMALKKKKAILEREVIQIILQEDEQEGREMFEQTEEI